MNVLEKILEEIDKLKEKCLLSEFESGYAAGALDMANAIKDVIHKCESDNDGWIPVEERLPEDCEEIVLVQVSGKPADNILFDNAFELALYEKEEGWMLDNYSEWKNPDVIAWCSLPELYRPKIVEKKHKNTQQEMEDFWNNK